MIINWTEEERTQATRHEVSIFMLNTTPENIKEMDAELPSDTHIVTMECGDEVIYDAVRAYKMSDIFDVYYDKLKKEEQDIKVVEITNGYGRIKPKLYGYQAPETKKK